MGLRKQALAFGELVKMPRSQRRKRDLHRKSILVSCASRTCMLTAIRVVLCASCTTGLDLGVVGRLRFLPGPAGKVLGESCALQLVSSLLGELLACAWSGLVGDR